MYHSSQQQPPPSSHGAEHHHHLHQLHQHAPSAAASTLPPTSSPPINRRLSMTPIIQRPSTLTVSPEHVVTLQKASFSWSVNLHSSHDDKIISPPFGTPTALFTITLYPRGVSEGKGSYLGAFLRPLKSDLEITTGDAWHRPVVAFTIAIRRAADASGSDAPSSVLASESSAANFRGFSNKVPGWGFSRLLELSKVSEALNPTDGSMVIDCDVIWEEAAAFNVFGTSVLIEEGQTDQMASQVFGLEEAPWYLRIVPTGDADGTDTHISAYLVAMKTHAEEAMSDLWSRPIISFTLRAKSMSGHVLASKTTTGGLAFTNLKPESGLSQLVELEKLGGPGYGGVIIECEMIMDSTILDPSTMLGKTRTALANQKNLTSAPDTDISSQHQQYLENELWQAQQQVAELKAQLDAASANGGPQNGDVNGTDNAEVDSLRAELENARRLLDEMEMQNRARYGSHSPDPLIRQSTATGPATGLSPPVDVNALIPNSVQQIKAEVRSANGVLLEASAKAPKPPTRDNEAERLAIVAELTMKEAELEVARAGLAEALSKGPSRDRSVYAKDIDSGRKELTDTLSAIRSLKAEVEGSAQPFATAAMAATASGSPPPPPLHKPLPHHQQSAVPSPTPGNPNEDAASLKTEVESLKERISAAKHALDGELLSDIAPRGRKPSYAGLSPRTSPNRFSQPSISPTLEGRHLEVLVRELQAARHRYRRKTSVLTACLYAFFAAFIIYSTLFVACAPRKPGGQIPLTCRHYILPTYEKAQPFLAAAGQYWHQASEWAVSEVGPKLVVAVEAGARVLETGWDIAKGGIGKATKLVGVTVSSNSLSNIETGETPRPVDIITEKDNIQTSTVSTASHDTVRSKGGSHMLTTGGPKFEIPKISDPNLHNTPAPTPHPKESVVTAAIEPSIEATSTTTTSIVDDSFEESITSLPNTKVEPTAVTDDIEGSFTKEATVSDNEASSSTDEAAPTFDVNIVNSSITNEENPPPPEPIMEPVIQAHGHELPIEVHDIHNYGDGLGEGSQRPLDLRSGRHEEEADVYNHAYESQPQDHDEL